MDAVVLLDVSSSMREHMPVVKTAVKSVCKRMTKGVRLAVVCYSDVCDETPVVLMNDFTDNPNKILSSIDGITYQNGGDVAESQHLAMCKLLSPSYLSWRSPNESQACVLHFTDTLPHSDDDPMSDPQLVAQERSIVSLETGYVCDWIEIGRCMDRAGVTVHGFLFKSEQFAKAAPWQAVMASLTGSCGVSVCSRDSHGLSKHIASILDGRPYLEGSTIRLTSDAVERLYDTPDEKNARHLLTDLDGIRIDGPDRDSRIALSKAFEGLVRHDATNSRCSMNPSSYECALRRSYYDLKKRVSEALERYPESEESEEDRTTDTIAMMTLRELCADFVSSNDVDEATPLLNMFKDVSKLVLGPTMCCPFTSVSGRYNYQSSFTVFVRAVRQGYGLCYSSFLDYFAIKRKGSWSASSRGELRHGVEDLVLRNEGDITGVLPMIPDNTPLAEHVFRLLSHTPWLNAIAWHSVCRHVFPPPHACLGLLCGALWCGAGDEKVSEKTMRLITRSIGCLNPARSTNGTEMSRCVLDMVTSKTPDVKSFVRSAVTQKVKKIPCVNKGILGYEADTKNGRYYVPTQHGAWMNEIRLSVLRLLDFVEIDVPDCLDSWIESEFLFGMFGVRSYMDLENNANPDSTGNSTEGKPRNKDSPIKVSGRTLPTMGTSRFNKSLTQAAITSRRVKGLLITGRPDEKIVLTRRDIPDDDASSGAELIRQHGIAEFAFVDGRWLPLRLGESVRIPELRSGRLVYKWHTPHQITSSSAPCVACSSTCSESGQSTSLTL